MMFDFNVVVFFYSSLHAGYGFVQLDDNETARKAMLRLNGKVMPSTSPVSTRQTNVACRLWQSGLNCEQSLNTDN